MVEFLRTSKIASHIEDVIVDAKDHITFVTPYLKFTKTLYERLVEKDEAGVKIRFVYGKSKLQDDQEQLLRRLKNISIYFLENLHAKCYTNEFAGIVTSMNLYDFSEKNNREMGIFFRKTDNESLYSQVNAEVESIIKASVLQHSGSAQSIFNNSSKLSNIDRVVQNTNPTEYQIETYNQRLINSLRLEYKFSQFEYNLRDDSITCDDFCQYFKLALEPRGSYYRIDFTLKGRDYKERQRRYDILYDHRKFIEKHYPLNVLFWGGQMLRLKFDFPQDTARMDDVSEQVYLNWVIRINVVLQDILRPALNF